MGKLQLFFSLLFIFLLISVVNTYSQEPAAAQTSNLLGNWECRTTEGILRLSFTSANQLVFDDEPANYTLVSGAIRIMDEFGVEDYPYTLSGNSLTITFPDGFQLQFEKAGMTPPPTQGKIGQASGTEYLLQGKLCRWSGSSSSTSSYSSTGWVFFDGQGNFSYGSESSFSSQDGNAYGGNNNSANKGQYRVEGGRVVLTFSDGSTGIAEVHFRQDDGRITELKYNGDLYGAALCD